MPPRGAKRPSKVQRRAERTRSLVGGESVDDYRHGDKRKNIPGSGQADYDTAPVERKKYAYDRERMPEADKRQAAKRFVEAMNYLHSQTKGTEQDLGLWVYLFVVNEDRYQVTNLLELLAQGKPWPKGAVSAGWPLGS